MVEQDWKLPYARCFGMLMVGQRLAERDEHGNAMVDDDLLLLLNAHHEPIEFTLPGTGWQMVLSTAEAAMNGETYPLQARSLALFARPGKDRLTASAVRDVPARSE
jgi:glycogen operon protein